MTEDERHACVTLLTDESYIPGAMALGESLRSRGWPHEKLVLVTDAVGREAREALLPWWDEIVPVDPVTPPEDQTFWDSRFETVYTKLRLWQLIRYDKLLYIDSDAIVLGSLKEALDRSTFAAAPALTPPDTFSAGVLVLEPDEDVFRDMISEPSMGRNYGLADQDFLNGYFSNWYDGPSEHRLSFVFNVNRLLYFVPPAWNRLRADMRILHLAGPRKPWTQRWGWPYRALHTALDRSGWRGEGPSPPALWWRTWRDARQYAPESTAVTKLGGGWGWPL